MVARAGGVVVVLVSGCGGTATSDLSCFLDATIDNSAIAFTIRLGQFSTQGPAFYMLDSDERLVARFRDDSVELHLFDDAYIGSIALRDIVPADESVRVDFDRGDEVIALEGTVPPPFTITPPIGATSRTDAVITWSPVAQDQMRWMGMGCDSAGEGPIPDDVGMLAFPPGVLELRGQDCAVEVDILRTRSARLHLPLRSNGVTVTQLATVSFEIAP